MRVTVRAKVYRGRAGFTVAWRYPDRSFPQRVFVELRAHADGLAAVVRARGDVDAYLREIWGQGEALGEGEAPKITPRFIYEGRQ